MIPVDESKVIPALVVPDIDKTKVLVPLTAVNESVERGIVTVVAKIEGPLTTISGLTRIRRATFATDPEESVTVTLSRYKAAAVVVSTVTTPVNVSIVIPALVGEIENFRVPVPFVAVKRGL